MSEQKHPSYGIMRIDRRTGTQRTLFGSPIHHTSTLCLTINEGSLDRHLNNNWYHAGKELIQVEMSHAQFAEIITSLNYGDGIPVTIRHINGQRMPEPPPLVHPQDQFIHEFELLVKQNAANAQALVEQTKELLNQPKPMTRAQKDQLIRKLTMLANDCEQNVTYLLTQYQESAGKITTAAKAEISAFMTDQLQMLNALAQTKGMPEMGLVQQNPIALPDEADELNETSDIPF